MAVKKKTLFAARPKASNFKNINKYTRPPAVGLTGLSVVVERPAASSGTPSGLN